MNGETKGFLFSIISRDGTEYTNIDNTKENQKGFLFSRISRDGPGTINMNSRSRRISTKSEAANIIGNSKPNISLTFIDSLRFQRQNVQNSHN